MSEYERFVEQKSFKAQSVGFVADLEGYPLFNYQADITRWACMRGKAAIFANTGLGKTLMQLTWADQVARHTGGKVLILAPLAVKEQTIGEAEKFGICMDNVDVQNYEQLHNIDTDQYQGVVLDESSILKGIDSKTRKLVQENFGRSASIDGQPDKTAPTNQTAQQIPCDCKTENSSRSLQSWVC